MGKNSGKTSWGSFYNLSLLASWLDTLFNGIIGSSNYSAFSRLFFYFPSLGLLITIIIKV